MKSLHTIDKNDINVTSVHIGADDLPYCTKETIQPLKQLHKISFNVVKEKDNHNSSLFPDALLVDNIDDLSITGVRVHDFHSLNLKKLKADIVAADFPYIVKYFKNLENITLNITGDITLDKTFLELKQLKHLSLSFHGNGKLFFALTDLSQLQQLTHLDLSGLSSSTLADPWCSLQHLTTLSLSNFQYFENFPLAIEKMTSLNTLTLCQVGQIEKNWNKAIVMPHSFSFLKNLQYFKSQFCPYRNCEPLTELRSLKEINIQHALFSEISDLSLLSNLDTLSLTHANKLVNIHGLRALAQLKTLSLDSTPIGHLESIKNLPLLESINIKNTPIDKNRFSTLSALRELKTFAFVKQVYATHISHREWQSIDKNALLTLPSNDQILATCHKGTRQETHQFENACLGILDINHVFNGKIEIHVDSERRDSISIFDKNLQYFVHDLNDSTLAHLVDISFSDTGLKGNYELTVIVLEEAILRKSIIIQQTMAQAFINAQRYYDSGHRAFAETVYDRLIDHYFPQFEEEPLAYILINSHSPLFKTTELYGDGLGELFYAYFKKTTNADIASQVLCQYKRYIFDELSQLEQPDDFKYISSRLNDNLNSAVIRDELRQLSQILETVNSALFKYNSNTLKKLMTVALLERHQKNIHYINWPRILGEDPIHYSDNIIDFQLCYSIFLVYYCDYYKQQPSTTALFFSILYRLDHKKFNTLLMSDIKANKIKGVQTLQTLTFDSHFNHADQNIELFLALLIGYLNGLECQQIIEQRNTIVQRQHAEAEAELIQSKLLEIFETVRIDITELDSFIRYTNIIAKQQALTESLSFRLAYYSARLLEITIHSAEFEMANSLFSHYADILFPFTGLHDETYNVISLGLVLAAADHNNNLREKVLAMIPRTDAEIKNIRNEIFLFNLACYQASINDDKAMILSITQALKYGKTAEEFLEDEDFKLYHSCHEFLTIVEDSR